MLKRKRFVALPISTTHLLRLTTTQSRCTATTADLLHSSTQYLEKKLKTKGLRNTGSLERAEHRTIHDPPGLHPTTQINV